jgi:uncharacterized protein (DUF2236 family)
MTTSHSVPRDSGAKGNAAMHELPDPHPDGGELAAMRAVSREGVLVAGGGAAILLQLANKAVGLGVAAHSDFATRPLDRLHATLSYAYVVTFGTPDERAQISAAVNAVHRPLVGEGYDANDPATQLWVAATLYDTGVKLYERIFGPLAPGVADEVYAQHAILGTSLQMSPELWPKNRDAFRTYWEAMIAGAEVSDAARTVARDILYPRAAPWVLRLTAPLNRLVTTGLLPQRLREAYGLPWSPIRERAFTALIAVTRLIYPRLPIAVREAPKERYLRSTRNRVRTSRS